MGKFLDTELEAELRRIADYIQTLKREIAALQANEMHLERIPAAGKELASVVNATEGATNEIMAIAESVLSADAADLESYRAMVRREMTALFEACAFQDLTGQRISRVVKTLQHIEARVSRFAGYARVEDAPGYATESEAKDAERVAKFMLSGPRAEHERNESNAQAIVGALFAEPRIANA
jgi:chemotaxis protein CheZ